MMELTISLVQMVEVAIAKMNQSSGSGIIFLICLRIVKAIAKMATKVKFLIRIIVNARVI